MHESLSTFLRRTSDYRACRARKEGGLPGAMRVSRGRCACRALAAVAAAFVGLASALATAASEAAQAAPMSGRNDNVAVGSRAHGGGANQADAGGPAGSADGNPCPAPTFATNGWWWPQLAGSPRVFCVCPPLFKCAGCGRMCKNTAFRSATGKPDHNKVPPIRCSQGFYPGTPQAAAATCVPTGEALGRVRVHRDRPCGLGGIEHRRNGPPSAGNATFAFAISNGHAGTKFLGSELTWRRRLPAGVPFPPGVTVEFERFPQNLAVQQIGLHANFCPLGRLYLKSIWWPQKDIDAFLTATGDAGSKAGTGDSSAAAPSSSSTLRTLFDSGHHASFLVSQLIDVLGVERVKLLRVRRDRIDLAYSKLVSVTASEHTPTEDDRFVGPCSKACVWCFCPLDAATVCVPPGDAWASMTPFQRFLWEVDELECVWRTVVARLGPRLRSLEVSWSDEMTDDDLCRIASFLGIPFASAGAPGGGAGGAGGDPAGGGGGGGQVGTERNRHVQDEQRAARNDTDLALQAEAYQDLLRPLRCDRFVCVWWDD